MVLLMQFVWHCYCSLFDSANAVCLILLMTQSRKLATYLFSFGAFAALAKVFAGNECRQNPRGFGLSAGFANPLAIF